MAKQLKWESELFVGEVKTAGVFPGSSEVYDKAVEAGLKKSPDCDEQALWTAAHSAGRAVAVAFLDALRGEVDAEVYEEFRALASQVAPD